MNKTFKDLFNELIHLKKKKLVVAVAQDKAILQAVEIAREENICNAILVGNENLIKNIAKELSIDLSNFELVNEIDEKKSVLKAVELVSTGEADMLMKGLVSTSTFLKGVLNKEVGLRTGKLMSHVAVFELEQFNKLIFMTDGAFNIKPNLKQKVDIVNNAVKVAKSCGIKTPKIAPICAIEVVNEDMQCTLDAAILSKMNERGQIKDCIIDGPLAFDNAFSVEAAIHKGIKSEVAGQADIFLMPDIESGNVMYKCILYTSKSKSGGLLVGTKAPVILTSRADGFETKINSIILAALVAQKNN